MHDLNRKRRYKNNMVNRKARPLSRTRTVTIPGYLEEPIEPIGEFKDTSDCEDRRFKPDPTEPRPDFSVLRRRREPHVIRVEDGPPTVIKRIRMDGEPTISDHDLSQRPYKKSAGSNAYRTMGHVEKGWVNYDAMRKDSRFYRTPLDD